MDADAQRDARFLRELPLNGHGAIDGFDGAVEHRERAVAVELQDAAAVVARVTLEHRALAISIAARPRLVLLQQ
jgi:hypothetical protein